MTIENKIDAAIHNNADKYVFEINGHKFSNNNNEAGDAVGIYKDGANFMKPLLLKALEMANLSIRGGCGNSGHYGQLDISPGKCAESPHACVDCKARKIRDDLMGLLEKEAFYCCGGNDDKPKEHCMDCDSFNPDGSMKCKV